MPSPTPRRCWRSIRTARGGYYLRGLVAAYQGDDVAAIADYDRALEREPGDLLTVGARARAYLRQGDAPKAIADCDRLIEAEPEEGVLWAMRGYARGMGGDATGAAADFDRALELVTDPEMIREIEGMRSELGIP